MLIIFKTYHSTFGVVVVNQSFGDMNSSNLRLKVFKRAQYDYFVDVYRWFCTNVVQSVQKNKSKQIFRAFKAVFICLVVASVNCTIISDWNAEKSSNTSSFTRWQLDNEVIVLVLRMIR